VPAATASENLTWALCWRSSGGRLGAPSAAGRAHGRIANREPRLARIAECRIFSGMKCHEVAEVLGVTERTVQREWLRV
jgi:hypothetical protein